MNFLPQYHWLTKNLCNPTVTKLHYLNSDITEYQILETVAQTWKTISARCSNGPICRGQHQGTGPADPQTALFYILWGQIIVVSIIISTIVSYGVAISKCWVVVDMGASGTSRLNVNKRGPQGRLSADQ